MILMINHILTMFFKNTKDYNNITLVIGNESCDLDSSVSSITYSAFLHWQYAQIKCKVCTKPHRSEDTYKDNIFVPVLNVDKQDFELKTEVAFCLREHGINIEHLIFRDDSNLTNLSPTTSILLVDHHVLSKRDQGFAPFVIEVLDHRPQDRTSWPYKEDTRCFIEMVGSCATIVAQRIKDLANLIRRDIGFFNEFPVCAKLLHATIILDTVNFSKEVNKATPHDEEIILFLEILIKPEEYRIERQQILDRLVAARRDVSGLSVGQLLRKDVKIVGDILVPSFPILVKEYLNMPGAHQAVTEALATNNCSTALLLGMDLTDGLRRDAAVLSPEHPDRSEQLSQCLKDWKNPTLQLIAEILDSSDCNYYKQMNLGASRKQYMPAVTQFVQKK